MDARELAEKIAYLLLEKGHIYDEDIAYEFGVDEFEVIKAKNILCRYYGIAMERWPCEDQENRQALFLTPEFSGDDGAELIHKVFHDPGFKTRRRIKEEERKSEIRGEVREILDRLKEEWGGLFDRQETG